MSPLPILAPIHIEMMPNSQEIKSQNLFIPLKDGVYIIFCNTLLSLNHICLLSWSSLQS